MISSPGLDSRGSMATRCIPLSDLIAIVAFNCSLHSLVRTVVVTAASNNSGTGTGSLYNRLPATGWRIHFIYVAVAAAAVGGGISRTAASSARFH